MTNHFDERARFEERLETLRRLMSDAERRLYFYDLAVSNYCSALNDKSASGLELVRRYVEPRRRDLQIIERQIAAIFNGSDSEPNSHEGEPAR